MLSANEKMDALDLNKSIRIDVKMICAQLKLQSLADRT
jgi:hypothetical protein